MWDGRGVLFNNRHGGTAHPDQAPVCRSAQEACRAQQAVQHEQAQVVSGWHVSTQSQSCDACCTAAGGSCVAESWPPELDEAAFTAALSSAASVEGLSYSDRQGLCRSFARGGSNFNPGMRSHGGFCYYHSSSGISCGAASEDYRRLCWCDGA